jgi:uncharacterized repeat protein (TIGR01451 family)
VFKDTQGNTITSTPLLPAGMTFDYIAVVTVSNVVSEALANSDRVTDANGHDVNNNALVELIDTDDDKDYVIKFNVVSSVDDGRKDFVSNAVDVNDIKAITITPDGQNQVQPGGTVEYPHTLKNDGNVDEAVELTSENSNGWSASTLIDTDGDGIGDKELTNLKVGDIIDVYGLDPNGLTITTPVTLTDSDLDGNVEFPLKPGQYVKLTNKVFAPAESPQGEVNTTKLTATDPNGNERNTAEDNSKVILGQVRLNKTVARQTNCTDSTTIGTFAAIQTEKVEPGQCVVWQIVAKNEGDARVKNVVVTDKIPTFTTSLPSSLTYCEGSNCTLGTVTDATGNDDNMNDNGEVSGGIVTFYIGGTAPVDVDNPAPDAENGKGGTLLSGESATMRFTVKVDE